MNRLIEGEWRRFSAHVYESKALPRETIDLLMDTMHFCFFAGARSIVNVMLDPDIPTRELFQTIQAELCGFTDDVRREIDERRMYRQRRCDA